MSYVLYIKYVNINNIYGVHVNNQCQLTKMFIKLFIKFTHTKDAISCRYSPVAYLSLNKVTRRLTE